MSNEILSEVSVKPITKENWKEAIELDVQEEQQSYVATNLKSIAESSFYDTSYNYGIYEHDVMVGFVLIYNPPEEPEIGHIVRFMIDKNYQRKGLGKKGIMSIIKMLASNLGRKFVTLTVIPENHGARKFYESVGFINTEEMVEGELKYKYTI